MKDINTEAQKALKKLDCAVVYQYPDSFSRLPAVSYYTLTEKGAFYCDNEESVQEGHIQVDVWARVPKECGELSVKINDILECDGWTREMSMDVPKKDEKVYHRTMRFKKYFNL